MDKVLVNLFNHIQNGNKEIVEKVIEKLPISSLEDDDRLKLLLDILIVCAEFNRSEIVPVILPYFYPLEELYEQSIITSLFLDKIPEDILKFVVKSVEESSYVVVIEELIQRNQGDEVEAARKAWNVFGEQPLDVIKSLFESAKEAENISMMEYLGNLIDERNDFAPIPPWVKDFNMKEEPKISGEIITIEDIDIEEIMKNFDYLGIDIEEKEEAKKLIEAKIRIGTIKEKKELFGEFLNRKKIEKLQDDIELFRWFGPDNPFYGSSSRMFTGNEYDYDEEEEKFEDWFTGACLNCHLRIRSRYHAVRIPMPFGGWSGCYCSIICLLKGIQEMEYENKEVDLIVRMMAKVLEEELMTFGIQDRK